MVSWRKVSSACNVTFVVTFFGCNFISRPFIEKDLAYLDKNVKFEARLQSVCNMQVKFSVSYKTEIMVELIIYALEIFIHKASVLQAVKSLLR